MSIEMDKARYSKHVQDMGNEELLSLYAQCRFSDDAKTELLRRLSAGNPQGEKVQITNNEDRDRMLREGELAAMQARTDREIAKAERSDGRIEHGKVLPVESDIEERSETLAGRIERGEGAAVGSGGRLLDRSGEQSETRIQDADMRSETRIDGDGEWGCYEHSMMVVPCPFCDRGTSVERAESRASPWYCQHEPMCATVTECASGGWKGGSPLPR